MRSARRTSTGTLVADPCYLVGIHFVSTVPAGTLEFKDGGGSGTSRLIVDTPAVAEGDTVFIPEPGLRFDTDLHVTLTNVGAVTVFYR